MNLMENEWKFERVNFIESTFWIRHIPCKNKYLLPPLYDYCINCHTLIPNSIKLQLKILNGK